MTKSKFPTNDYVYKKNNETRYIRRLRDEFIFKDPRRTLFDFYRTFRIDSIYSEAGLYLVLSGNRNFVNNDFKSFIDRAFDIYGSNVPDYSSVTPIQVQQMLKDWNASSHIHIDAQSLSIYFGLARSVFSTALKSRSNYTMSIYEMINLGLVPDEKNPQTMYNTFTGYWTLKRKIMRAMAGDGLHFTTLEELSLKTGIPLDNLEHVETLCRNRDKFLNAYDLLTVKTLNYDIDILKRKGK